MGTETNRFPASLKAKTFVVIAVSMMAAGSWSSAYAEGSRAQSTGQEKSTGVAVNIGIGGDNRVGNVSGMIAPDADVEGVTVINGQVSIDGVMIQRGVGKYRSPKSGRAYLIKWGKGDDVSITEQ